MYQAQKAICKAQAEVPEIPFEVWTCFWEKYPRVEIYGHLGIAFEGDIKDLEKMQKALSWLVKQFNGEVKWK